jgi:hypothetical protein
LSEVDEVDLASHEGKDPRVILGRQYTIGQI